MNIKVQMRNSGDEINNAILSETFKIGYGHVINLDQDAMIDVVVIDVSGFNPETRENRLVTVVIPEEVFDAMIRSYIKKKLE